MPHVMNLPSVFLIPLNSHGDLLGREKDFDWFLCAHNLLCKENNEVHSNGENLIFGGGRVNHQCVLSFRLRLWLNLKFEISTSTKNIVNADKK